MGKQIPTFVGVALSIQEKLEVYDKETQGIIMRFSKMYKPDKMRMILERTKEYPWWRTNTKAAFMKSVGDINKDEKIRTME